MDTLWQLPSGVPPNRVTKIRFIVPPVGIERHVRPNSEIESFAFTWIHDARPAWNNANGLTLWSLGYERLRTISPTPLHRSAKYIVTTLLVIAANCGMTLQCRRSQHPICIPGRCHVRKAEAKRAHPLNGCRKGWPRPIVRANDCQFEARPSQVFHEDDKANGNKRTHDCAYEIRHVLSPAGKFTAGTVSNANRSRIPVAAASRSSVRGEGSTLPLSSRAMTAYVVCMRSASCLFVRPARARGSSSPPPARTRPQAHFTPSCIGDPCARRKRPPLLG